MIAAHQPTIFPEGVLAHFSSRDDGTMLMREISRHTPEAVANRQKLFTSLGLDYNDMVFQVISYTPRGTYNTVAIVDGRHRMAVDDGTIADAFITDQPGIALLLPVADCVATTLYDPIKRVLATLHLGRHSTVTDLVTRTVTIMSQCFGSQPQDILAYLSPAAQKESYGLEYFEPANEFAWIEFVEKRDGMIYVDLPGYNRRALEQAGLRPEHIEVSSVDVYAEEGYFSHSRGDKNGREALVAMII